MDKFLILVFSVGDVVREVVDELVGEDLDGVDVVTGLLGLVSGLVYKKVLNLMKNSKIWIILKIFKTNFIKSKIYLEHRMISY